MNVERPADDSLDDCEHVLKRVSRNALLADYIHVRTERDHG